MNDKVIQKRDEGPYPEYLPILPLKGSVIFPLTLTSLSVGLPRSVNLIEEALAGNRLLFLVAQKDGMIELPSIEQLHLIGTIATIHQIIRDDDKSIRVVVQGLERGKLLEMTSETPYLKGRIERFPDVISEGMKVEGMRHALLDALKKMAAFSGPQSEELMSVVEAIREPRQLIYTVASTLSMGIKTQQDILELNTTEEKLERMLSWIQHEIAIRELGRKITHETKERLTKDQREYFLRQQISSIKQELGEGDEDSELGDLKKRLDEANLPEEARKEADRELKRLSDVPSASPEHGIILTYLDWLASLPWNKKTGGAINIKRAREILDEDHYDLEKIKDRIIEYLAVRKLREDRQIKEVAREPLLCFVGPPGVGKTSLGQSIAKALNRKFARISLGGMRDEAEIRGHRRTYISAMPGRIIQEIKRADSNDVVFMLDEIDKIGSDWRGDPSSALLEVLDPAQNHHFVDLYLGVGFDLSQVLFIATANTLDSIPAPLLDRMEVIHLSGYTDNEKLHIAEQYLIPKEREAHGLTATELSIEPGALQEMIRGYTREAGVRNLDRNIANVCRKVAKKVADGEISPVILTKNEVKTYLGPVKFFDEVAERTTRPGVATGLAWTQVGGEILFIEATLMPSKDEKLILTGMLGDVMRESAQAALSYIRSHLSSLGIPKDKLDGKAIHIHVPEGAIPKDGPSAGITMVTALVSLLCWKPVRSDLAMTGEITLRGKVLPIGGVKEKVLAAQRIGIRSVMLPYHNKSNVEEDIGPELRESMHFIYVKTIEEALRHAFEGVQAKRKKKTNPDELP